jgi:hypothetical protein
VRSASPGQAGHFFCIALPALIPGCCARPLARRSLLMVLAVMHVGTLQSGGCCQGGRPRHMGCTAGCSSLPCHPRGEEQGRGRSPPKDLRLCSVLYAGGAVQSPAEQKGWARWLVVQCRQICVLLAWRVRAGCCVARAALQRRPAYGQGHLVGGRGTCLFPCRRSCFGRSCHVGHCRALPRGRHCYLGASWYLSLEQSVFAPLACCCVPFSASSAGLRRRPGLSAG